MYQRKYVLMLLCRFLKNAGNYNFFVKFTECVHLQGREIANLQGVVIVISRVLGDVAIQGKCRPTDVNF